MLSDIYQASLNQGRIPADWKHAWVIPVYKKGAKTSPSNYRCITSIACKTLEHIIHSNLMDHLERHNILSDRKRRSCETQLIQAVDDLAKCLNDGGQIDAVLLDFSKTFDKVPHHHLATKLEEDPGMGEKLSEQPYTGSDPGRENVPQELYLPHPHKRSTKPSFLNCTTLLMTVSYIATSTQHMTQTHCKTT